MILLPKSMLPSSPLLRFTEDDAGLASIVLLLSSTAFRKPLFSLS